MFAVIVIKNTQIHCVIETQRVLLLQHTVHLFTSYGTFRYTDGVLSYSRWYVIYSRWYVYLQEMVCLVTADSVFIYNSCEA